MQTKDKDDRYWQKVRQRAQDREDRNHLLGVLRSAGRDYCVRFGGDALLEDTLLHVLSECNGAEFLELLSQIQPVSRRRHW